MNLFIISSIGQNFKQIKISFPWFGNCNNQILMFTTNIYNVTKTNCKINSRVTQYKKYQAYKWFLNKR